MPQASQALRDRWNGPSDATALRFLHNAGYNLTYGWTWVKPHPDHTPSEPELSAIEFLIEEWDFGGIASDFEQDGLRL